MVEKLNSNWPVSSKLTLGIWQILTWALENLEDLHFNGLLLTKVYNGWAKISTEDLCLMVLNTDVKFEGKLTCAFKNDTTWHISAEKQSMIFLKIISQFCISQWSVGRKVFDKL